MPRSRMLTFFIIVGLACGFFLAAFWPRATYVDLANVSEGRMMVTIDEEARARVRDVYVVSTPVAGRLMRVEVQPGDAVIEGRTVVARMLPVNPDALDIRTEEQAAASVAAAKAALELARAESARAEADVALARSTRDRRRTLVEEKVASQAALDQAERDLRAAVAAARSAQAAIGMREADLQRAEAMVADFVDAADQGSSRADLPLPDATPILAPISGLVLRVLHESETTLPAGSAIMHLGDPNADLEIVAELLSPDAVRVKAGDRVIVERWGGDEAMPGVVERVEPWAFTKVSALGVEEQRANVIINLDCANALHSGLGHDYRVYVRIVTWEREDAVHVPSNTLFRHDDGWAVFNVRAGRARLSPVVLGQNNGLEAEILEGVAAGDAVVLYPSDNLRDGAKVRQRG